MANPFITSLRAALKRLAQEDNDIRADVALALADYVTSAALTSTLAGYATDAEVAAQVAALVDAAPGTLDTLNELAAALGDDPNFATTVTNAIAARIALSVIQAKGDLLVGTGAGAVARLAVGADGTVPMASAAAPGGIAWAAPGGGITEYADVAAVNAITTDDFGVITLADVSTLIAGVEAGIGSTVYLRTFNTNAGFGGALTPGATYAPLVQEAVFYQGDAEGTAREYRRTRYWDGISAWTAWGAWTRVYRYKAPFATPNFASTYALSRFDNTGDTILQKVAGTIQLPTNASEPIPVGSNFWIMRDTTGAVSVAALSGVTLRNPYAVATLRAQYSIARVTKTATNTWVLSGDIG